MRPNGSEDASIRDVPCLQEGCRTGIVFFGTRSLAILERFYCDLIGLDVWLRQADCFVLRSGNLLLGFCQRDSADTGGIITIVCRANDQVNEAYESLLAAVPERLESAPVSNPKYGIYHFFVRDPEERRVGFQSFLEPVAPSVSGRDLLVERRSVRDFLEREVPEQTLREVLHSCSFSPSASNRASTRFVVIRDTDLLAKLAAVRGDSSAPIGRAPLAVAVCADSSMSRSSVQNACIASYHLLLSAWTHDLGTCWVGGMDRPEARELLGLPASQSIVCVTPLGYPSLIPAPPSKAEPEVSFMD